MFVRAIETYYPNLELKIKLAFSDPLIHDLAHNRIELALTVIPDSVPRFLTSLFAYKERFYLVGKKIPENLNTARWVLIEKGTQSRLLIDRYLKQNLKNYNVHFEINSFHNILSYLKHSEDLSVLPSSVITNMSGLKHKPLPLYRNCGLLVGSPSLAVWLDQVVADFRQSFLSDSAKEGDIIPVD